MSLRNGSHVIRIVIVYRPQDNLGNPFGTFIKEINNLITDMSKQTSPFLFVGDFNIQMNQPEKSIVKTFNDVLSNHDLEQMVNDATNNISLNTIDLVIKSPSASILNVTTAECDLSDHNIVIFRTKFTKPEQKKVTVKCRKLKAIEPQALNNDISEFLNTTDSVTVEKLDKQLRKLLEEHAPLTDRTVKDRKCPWFNEHILKARKEKRQCERRWLKTRQTIDKMRFIEARKVLNKIKFRAKQEFFISKLQISHAKDYQRTLNILTCKESASPLPNYSDDKVKIADDFMNFFQTKIEKIQEELSQTPPHDAFIEFEGSTHLTHFQQVAEEEILRIIMQSTSKSCELDSLPTNILKTCMESLIRPITNIINLSLETGIVPSIFKQAIIRPLLKKQNLDINDLKNFRPVSNLPFLSKILEKVVLAQIVKHLQANNLEEQFQSAYRSHHSTETATLRIANDLLKSADQKEVAIVTLLDASAAFDCVDHAILLKRLEETFGVTGTALKWIASYLADRTQCVVIDEGHSQSTMLTCGVPQGSCLGPALYTVYTMPVYNIYKRANINFHAYADDIQLYTNVSIKVSNVNEKRAPALEYQKGLIETAVQDTKIWMNENRLKLNESKTECLIVGNRNTMRNFNSEFRSNFKLSLNGSEIFPSAFVKNLGVYFDSELTFKDHINRLCRSIYLELKKLSYARKFLTVQAAKTLAVQLILSKIDYCNSLLYGANEDLLDKLQIAMNNTARVVLQKKRRDSASQMLSDLHWLPIRERIQFKLATLCYGYFDGSLPPYLKDQLTLYQPNRSLRSSDDKRKFVTPKTNTRLGEKAWHHAGPKIWNDLPKELRYSESKKIFKKNLKTYFFNN